MLISPFEKLTSVYGTPRYREVEPTIFFALSFLLLFGMMFGDVGQGGVLFLLGYFIFRRSYKYLDYGIILMECGFSSALFGILYGSVFGLEHLLPALWFRPMDNIPYFIKLTLSLGVALVSLGLVLNLINAIRLKEYENLLGAGGLAESAKGRNVNVVTTEWIASYYEGWDLSAKMRTFLLEKYPSDSWGILDVCLIGDVDYVPMRTTWQDPETDYYYAELSLPDSQSWDPDGDHQYGESSDPIDFATEVNTGRIPWSNPDTVQSICEKTVAYEQNQDDAFKKNILLIGTFFWPDTDNAVLMEAKVDQEWMTDWTMTRMYEDAQSPYPCDYDATYNNVELVWSTGSYAFVDWAGHGSPDAAYEYYPSQPFVDEATCLSLNDEFPSIVFADSCSNSDTDYLNTGEAMLKQGAIGFLGSNKVAYGMPGWNNAMDGSSQSLDYFFTTCCTSGNYTQGQALQWSLREMYVNDLWTAGTYMETFEWGSIFGNPDLSMGPVTTSDPPANPSAPYGPTHGTINKQYTFTSMSTDPNNDQIYYLFNWGDGSNSGWLGPYSSGLTVAGSHSWSAIGNYTVKVKAKDVNGATSDWSEPLTITIVLNDAPDIPIITGPASGAPGKAYLFKMQTTDANEDDVFYYIDWGDGTTSDWLGPYNSGADATTTHSWSEQGTYTVKIKAKDTVGFPAEPGSRRSKNSSNRRKREC